MDLDVREVVELIGEDEVLSCMLDQKSYREVLLKLIQKDIEYHDVQEFKMHLNSDTLIEDYADEFGADLLIDLFIDNGYSRDVELVIEKEYPSVYSYKYE